MTLYKVDGEDGVGQEIPHASPAACGDGSPARFT
jgi:hypothetical protein